MTTITPMIGVTMSAVRIGKSEVTSAARVEEKEEEQPDRADRNPERVAAHQTRLHAAESRAATARQLADAVHRAVDAAPVERVAQPGREPVERPPDQAAHAVVVEERPAEHARRGSESLDRGIPIGRLG